MPEVFPGDRARELRELVFGRRTAFTAGTDSGGNAGADGETTGGRSMTDIGVILCADLPPDTYHPDSGRPDDLALARCGGCPSRLGCLALALRTEPSDQRHGWFGGLGPAERDRVAAALGLTPPPTPDRAAEVIRLHAAGWQVGAIASHLRCSRRTVQRHLHRPLDAVVDRVS